VRRKEIEVGVDGGLVGALVENGDQFAQVRLQTKFGDQFRLGDVFVRMDH